MENIITVLAVIAVIIAVVLYLIRSKKKGAACLGCSYGGRCSGCCGQWE